MEQEWPVRAEARASAAWCAGDGLSPWISAFLRDASEGALEEMWCLGADHVGSYRDDAPIETAHRLVAAIERELRRRASASLSLPENIAGAIVRAERPWRPATARSEPSAP